MEHFIYSDLRYSDHWRLLVRTFPTAANAEKGQCNPTGTEGFDAILRSGEADGVGYLGEVCAGGWLQGNGMPMTAMGRSSSSIYQHPFLSPKRLQPSSSGYASPANASRAPSCRPIWGHRRGNILFFWGT